MILSIIAGHRPCPVVCFWNNYLNYCEPFFNWIIFDWTIICEPDFNCINLAPNIDLNQLGWFESVGSMSGSSKALFGFWIIFHNQARLSCPVTEGWNDGHEGCLWGLRTEIWSASKTFESAHCGPPKLDPSHRHGQTTYLSVTVGV